MVPKNTRCAYDSKTTFPQLETSKIHLAQQKTRGGGFDENKIKKVA